MYNYPDNIQYFNDNYDSPLYDGEDELEIHSGPECLGCTELILIHELKIRVDDGQYMHLECFNGV